MQFRIAVVKSRFLFAKVYHKRPHALVNYTPLVTSGSRMFGKQV